MGDVYEEHVLPFAGAALRGVGGRRTMDWERVATARASQCWPRHVRLATASGGCGSRTRSTALSTPGQIATAARSPPRDFDVENAINYSPKSRPGIQLPQIADERVPASLFRPNTPIGQKANLRYFWMRSTKLLIPCSAAEVEARFLRRGAGHSSLRVCAELWTLSQVTNLPSHKLDLCGNGTYARE